MSATKEIIIQIAEDIEKRTGESLTRILEDMTDGEYGNVDFLSRLYDDRENRKIIICTDDFYTDFWIFSTSDPADLVEVVKDLTNQRPHDIDENKHRLLYNSTSDTFLQTDKALNLCDDVIFNSDFCEI